MINLMNVVAPQEGADTVQPVSTASHGPHGPPETQGLFAMLLEALCVSAGPGIDGGPVPVVADAESGPLLDDDSADAVLPDIVLSETQSAVEPVDPMPDEGTAALPVGNGEQPAGLIDAALSVAGKVTGAETVVQSGDQPSLSAEASLVDELVQPVPGPLSGEGTVGEPLQPTGETSAAPLGEEPSVAGGQRHPDPPGERVSADTARATVRAGPQVTTAEPASRPAEVTIQPTGPLRPRAVPAGANEPVSGDAVQADTRPARDAPLVKEATVTNQWAGNGVRSAVTSAARDTGSQMNGTPSDGGPELGSRDMGPQYTAGRNAGGDTGGGVPSQPTPAFETVGAAQPEVNGMAKDKPMVNDRTAAVQVNFTVRSAGRGLVGRVAQPVSARGAAAAESPVVDQVVKVVRTLIGEQRSEMRVRLWPPHLGELRVRLVHAGESLRVELVAESGAARDLLDARLPELRQALAEIRGPRTDVTVTVTASDQPPLAAFTPNHGGPHTPYQQPGRPHVAPQGPPGPEQPNEAGGERPAPNVAVVAGHIDVHA